MIDNIPDNIKKYFWGDDLEKLSWEKHQDYITKTILEKGDKDAVLWLFNKTSKKYLLSIARTKKMEPKSKNFWTTYLS